MLALQGGSKSELAILLFRPAYKSKCHFLIAVYLLRWGGNSCVNTAVSMETVGFPYLFFPLTQIVHVVLALKSSESSQAPLLCFSLSLSLNPGDWCVIWMTAMCVTNLGTQQLCNKTFGQYLSLKCLYAFSAWLKEEHEFGLLLMVKSSFDCFSHFVWKCWDKLNFYEKP